MPEIKPLTATWKFRAADYPEAADQIFRNMRSQVGRVGGTCTTDGQYFYVTGTDQAYQEAREVLADYGAEWELTIVPERRK